MDSRRSNSFLQLVSHEEQEKWNSYNHEPNPDKKAVARVLILSQSLKGDQLLLAALGLREQWCTQLIGLQAFLALFLEKTIK